MNIHSKILLTDVINRNSNLYPSNTVIWNPNAADFELINSEYYKME